MDKAQIQHSFDRIEMHYNEIKNTLLNQNDPETIQELERRVDELEDEVSELEDKVDDLEMNLSKISDLCDEVEGETEIYKVMDIINQIKNVC